MDIPAQSWKSGIKYFKDNIVKVENLAAQSITNPFQQEYIRNTLNEKYRRSDDDQSSWQHNMYNTKLGWGAWDPNDLKYTNLSEKTDNPEDYPLLYHTQNNDIYTSFFRITDEADWLQEEINNDNYDNLLVQYFDEHNEVINEADGTLLEYTGDELKESTEGSVPIFGAPIHLGIAAPGSLYEGNSYLSVQFKESHTHVRVKITRIDSEETITSTIFVVASYADPKLGLDSERDLLGDGSENLLDVKFEFNSNSAAEKSYGSYFPVNPDWNYSASAMVKKSSEESELNDNFKTLLVQDENGNIVSQDSIGVGVNIIFYDENLNRLNVSDKRKNHRVVAQSELNDLEYLNIYLDIHSNDIPNEARLGRVFACTYGIKNGSFQVEKVSAHPTSAFFYCYQDHESTNNTQPGSEKWYDTGYWTQNFEWRPSYGSKASFVALNDILEMGDGADYVNNLAINSLPLEIDVSFNNRTDIEAKAIMHFLQEKHFAYESIFSIDYRGERLLSGDVADFRFIYTHPFKENLRFTCTDFSHSIVYRNNNIITAKFVCNTESGLQSLESHAGFNPKLDALIPIIISQDTEFKKGEQITLNAFSTADDNAKKITSGEEDIYGISVVGNNAQISFNAPQDMKAGDCIFVEVSEEDSIFNVGLSKIIEKIDDTNYIFGPILSEGNESSIEKIKITQLERCPSDCLISQPLIPEQIESISPYSIDPSSGEIRKRVVMLRNYRKLQIDSEINKDSNSVLVTPLSDFKLSAGEDFYILVPAIRGRSSMYLKDPERTIKYPWLKVRNFEQKPSLAFQIENTPEHNQSNFIKHYNKKYKKQINQNLAKFTVVFDQRSDEEVLDILQFLESHLGCKKFRFVMPRPYIGGPTYEGTPSGGQSSVFYCPSWDHEIVYKNNHKITATFIESVTSRQEDLNATLLETGTNQEGLPCYSAYIDDPITYHEACVGSSRLQAANCAGFEDLGDKGLGIKLKNKAVDLIFIIDVSSDITGGKFNIGGESIKKFEAAIDLIKKTVVAYDDYRMPGTNSYAGAIDTPNISFVNVSGGGNVPPWAVDSTGASLIDAAVNDINADLASKGFNVDNFERFKVKVDQQRVNIGLVLFEEGVQLDCSHPQNAFDKKNIYDKLSTIPTAVSDYPRNEGEYYTKAISLALAQMYNSPRAEYVTDRIIITLSDGMIFDNTHDNDAAGTGQNLYSPTALEICKNLRSGGQLAKRRPKDQVLENFGHNGNTIKKFLDKYKTQKLNDNQSLYFHPDNGGANPDWYEEPLNTIFISAALGNPDDLSTKLKDYVYDFEDQTGGSQFYLEVSSPVNRNEESSRFLDLFNSIEILTDDSGYFNNFSITLYNHGPHSVEVKNSVINLKNMSEPMRWTTKRLKSGIPKGGAITELEYIRKNETIGNLVNGHGGQYYNDNNNKNLLTELSNSRPNILWESFNTKYEVYRNCELSLINQGWKNKPTKGVNNVGVAYKGMPVRVFSGTSGIEIIDYNIGNASSQNPAGDYSHLPKIKPGESLDLFFGIRSSSTSKIEDEVQVVFDTDDGTPGKTESHAEFSFPITSEGQRKTEPIQVTQEEEPVINPGVGPEIGSIWLLNVPVEGNGLINKIFAEHYLTFISSNEVIYSVVLRVLSENGGRQVSGNLNDWAPFYDYLVRAGLMAVDRLDTTGTYSIDANQTITSKFPALNNLEITQKIQDANFDPGDCDGFGVRIYMNPARPLAPRCFADSVKNDKVLYGQFINSTVDVLNKNVHDPQLEVLGIAEMLETTQDNQTWVETDLDRIEDYYDWVVHYYRPRKNE
jgi:phage-related protein